MKNIENDLTEKYPFFLAGNGIHVLILQYYLLTLWSPVRALSSITEILLLANESLKRLINSSKTPAGIFSNLLSVIDNTSSVVCPENVSRWKFCSRFLSKYRALRLLGYLIIMSSNFTIRFPVTSRWARLARLLKAWGSISVNLLSWN